MLDVAGELLYVISSRQTVPWPAFKDAFDSLCGMHQSYELSRIKAARQQVVRNLDCLAHCDFVFAEEGSQVYPAPPALARLPHRGFEAVLCGARAPGSLVRLTQAAAQIDQRCTVAAEEVTEELSLAPARIVLRSPSVDALVRIAESIGITFSPVPPAWLLANLAPSLHDITKDLNWRRVDEPNWPLKDFDVLSQSFRARSTGSAGQPIRLTSYLDPRTRQYLTLAWHDGRSAIIDRDWGRYWILAQNTRRVLQYDERRLTFSAPAGAPLPVMYARILTLCSGALPDLTTNGIHPKQDRRIAYGAVPQQIARVVSTKLDLGPVETNTVQSKAIA